MYKAIANIHLNDDANDVYDELTDRFGAPPAPVYGLVEIALLRNTAMQLGINEIKQKGTAIAFYLDDVKVEYLVALNSKLRGKALFKSAAKPYFTVQIENGNPVDTVRETLHILQEA
jgi:transcription-repair coupling factor (superfamily II helicase)